MNNTDYRRADGTIDLCSAFSDIHEHNLILRDHWYVRGILKDVESIHPIRSRQTAAVALVMAEKLWRMWDENNAGK